MSEGWGVYPGYKAIADALGYRVVAGPSGTTSDSLQVHTPREYCERIAGLMRTSPRALTHAYTARNTHHISLMQVHTHRLSLSLSIYLSISVMIHALSYDTC